MKKARSQPQHHRAGYREAEAFALRRHYVMECSRLERAAHAHLTVARNGVAKIMEARPQRAQAQAAPGRKRRAWPSPFRSTPTPPLSMAAGSRV